eukprot:m.54131 g.54131  ORF g.54131 m.54131 type:complete len:385 (+) comp13227_c0_seq1:172-1326(+)
MAEEEEERDTRVHYLTEDQCGGCFFNCMWWWRCLTSTFCCWPIARALCCSCFYPKSNRRRRQQQQTSSGYPLYYSMVRLSPTWAVVRLVFFYNYNPSNDCSAFIGTHEGDIEHFSIFGKVDSEDDASCNFEPTHVFISAHDGGEVLRWSAAGGRPLKVYVARGSHAAYSSPGKCGPLGFHMSEYYVAGCDWTCRTDDPLTTEVDFELLPLRYPAALNDPPIHTRPPTTSGTTVCDCSVIADACNWPEKLRSAFTNSAGTSQLQAKSWFDSAIESESLEPIAGVADWPINAHTFAKAEWTSSERALIHAKRALAGLELYFDRVENFMPARMEDFANRAVHRAYRPHCWHACPLFFCFDCQIWPCFYCRGGQCCPYDACADTVRRD